MLAMEHTNKMALLIITNTVKPWYLELYLMRKNIYIWGFKIVAFMSFKRQWFGLQHHFSICMVFFLIYNVGDTQVQLYLCIEKVLVYLLSHFAPLGGFLRKKFIDEW